MIQNQKAKPKSNDLKMTKSTKASEWKRCWHFALMELVSVDYIPDSVYADW